MGCRRSGWHGVRRRGDGREGIAAERARRRAVSWRRKQGRMIQIKTPDEIALMREAGLVVWRALQRLREAVAPGITTADLDRIAEESIRAERAVPSFKGYRGFPRTICTSINDEVVHGIPSRRRRLRAGDLISIDCGAIL